jgi:hypothetical protein
LFSRCALKLLNNQTDLIPPSPGSNPGAPASQIVVAALILGGSEYQFAWLRPGVVRSAGLSGMMLIAGVIGLVAGIIRDGFSS